MSEWLIKEKFGLPENWEIFRLHDLTNQIVDGTHFTPKYIENGIPFLRVTDIQTKKIEFEGLKFVSKEEHELLKLRCYPKRGDILVSKNGSIGIIKIVDWDWEFSIFVSLALIKTNKDIYNEYLKYLLQSEIVWWQIKLRAKQGTVTNLHLEEIRELEIPTPSLPVQRRIAQILTTTDAVIEKTQAAIAKYKAIKQGMLHDLFTRGIDLVTNQLRPSYAEAPELYKESKLGWIPKEWDESPLEELVDIDLEQLNSTTDPDFSFFYIDISSVSTGQIIYPNHPFRFQDAPSRARRIIKHNDILMSSVRPNLKAFAHFKRKSNYQFIASTGFAILSPKIKTDIDFVYQVLFTEYFERQIDKYVVGSNYPAINSTDLKNLLVNTPKKHEQKAISKRILTIDNKLQSEQNYLQKLQNIKKGLMEDLLSGKKLVKVPVELEIKNEG